MPYVTKDFLIGPSFDGVRLDVVVASLSDGISRAAAARLIEDGQVSINGVSKISKSERVVLGDKILVCFEIAPPSDNTVLVPPNFSIELTIPFEDDYLAVISKQAGLVCHPGIGHVDDTLASALVARYTYDGLGHLQGEDRPGIVHRLDRKTSGLMLVAKDDATQQSLQDLIRMRTLDRRYIVLVQGYVAADAGSINASIARSRRDRLRMTVSEDPDAREAITTFETLERFEADRHDDGFSLLECHLYTGRTHQIRVHMRYIHHDVVGDALYGHGGAKRNCGLKRQFLHSWYVSFEHPVTGENVLVRDTLPPELTDVLEFLSARSMGRTERGKAVLSLLGR